MNYVTKVVKKESKKMNIKVEAVSNKFGPSFKANGIWHNPDKVANPDLSSIRPGDELEAEVNGKWVKSFTIVSRGNPVPNTQAKPTGQAKQYVQGVGASDKTAAIIRGNAANAAFGAAFTYYSTNADEAEAFQKALDVVERLEDYLTNGRSK